MSWLIANRTLVNRSENTINFQSENVVIQAEKMFNM